MSIKKVIIEHIKKFEISGSRSGAPEDSSIVGRNAVSLGKRFPTLWGTVKPSTSKEHVTLKMKELHSFETSGTPPPPPHPHHHTQQKKNHHEARNSKKKKDLFFF